MVGPSVVVMEQQPEHEGASEVMAPGPPPIWPGASVPGVALGEVFGDLASWKSARGRETAASPASWMPSANTAAVVDGAVAGVEGAEAGVEGAEARVSAAEARVSAADAGVEEADAAVEKAEARVGAAGIEASAAGCLLDWLEVAAHATEKAVGEPAWRHTEDGLGAAMRLIGQLRSCLDRVEVAVVAEVESQGTPDGRGLSPVDWLVDASGAAAPKPDVQHVARVLNVARAMGSSEPASDVFSEAVRSGAMPLVKADLVARFVQDVRRVADPEALAADVETLVEAASDNHRGRGLTAKELRGAIQFATQLIKPAKDLEREEHRRRLARSLHKSQGAAGMSRYQLTLDAEGAAVLDAAVQALSAPVKGLDGEPDPRSAAARRADALLEVVRRGVSSPGEQPKTEKAHVVVTIPLAHLIEQCRGAGLTMNGDLLSPAVVRRMACDARVIPMVLGSKGDVLDIGLGDRFFTPAQRTAVWHRDRHCTFPGCTIPAEWCDIHHVQWWSRGGPTDFANAALLCGRHHTLVHLRDLTATVTDTGVTWHV